MAKKANLFLNSIAIVIVAISIVFLGHSTAFAAKIPPKDDYIGYNNAMIGENNNEQNIEWRINKRERDIPDTIVPETDKPEQVFKPWMAVVYILIIASYIWIYILSKKRKNVTVHTLKNNENTSL